MRSLYVPLWKRAFGNAMGWIVFALVRILLALPRPVLRWKLSAAIFLMKIVGGDGPNYRAAAQLREIVKGGGVGAQVLDRMATRSRPADIVAMVRGAVIRGLP